MRGHESLFEILEPACFYSFAGQVLYFGKEKISEAQSLFFFQDKKVQTKWSLWPSHLA